MAAVNLPLVGSARDLRGLARVIPSLRKLFGGSGAVLA